MTLQPGDHVRWDIPNASDYPEKYGEDIVMIVRSVDSEYAYVENRADGKSIGSGGAAFFHHRFKVIPKFLILAEQAIKSKEKHARSRSKKGQ